MSDCCHGYQTFGALEVLAMRRGYFPINAKKRRLDYFTLYKTYKATWSRSDFFASNVPAHNIWASILCAKAFVKELAFSIHNWPRLFTLHRESSCVCLLLLHRVGSIIVVCASQRTEAFWKLPASFYERDKALVQSQQICTSSEKLYLPPSSGGLEEKSQEERTKEPAMLHYI